MKQILSGVQYMHDEMSIMHRDLKPDNIMINLNPIQVKIIDFGTCKVIDPNESKETMHNTSYVCTRWYRSPEQILRSHIYSFNSDVFALGCVFAECYLLKPLFPGSSEFGQIDTLFKILGTPRADQWREGFKMAEKR